MVSSLLHHSPTFLHIIHKNHMRAFPGSPVVRTPQSCWVQSLVRELRSNKPHSVAKKIIGHGSREERGRVFNDRPRNGGSGAAMLQSSPPLENSGAGRVFRKKKKSLHMFNDGLLFAGLYSRRRSGSGSWGSSARECGTSTASSCAPGGVSSTSSCPSSAAHCAMRRPR